MEITVGVPDCGCTLMVFNCRHSSTPRQHECLPCNNSLMQETDLHGTLAASALHLPVVVVCSDHTAYCRGCRC